MSPAAAGRRLARPVLQAVLLAAVGVLALQPGAGWAQGRPKNPEVPGFNGALPVGAAPVPLGTAVLSGGGPGGSSWVIDNLNGTSNGLPAGGFCNSSPGLGVFDARLGAQIDAFDDALMLFVNNQIFVAPPTVDVTGSTLTAGPVSIGGLNVTMQYFAAQQTAILRSLATFQNPSGAPISISATWVSNVGSDGATGIRGTSSGDTTFTTADRWVVTSDSAADPINDPANTFVLFGPGAPQVTPNSVATTVFDCFGTQGILASYPVVVPPGATRRLLFFNELSPSNATALASANAPGFVGNTNPQFTSEWLSGLTTTQLNEVVNWDFSPRPTATPTPRIVVVPPPPLLLLPPPPPPPALLPPPPPAPRMMAPGGPARPTTAEVPVIPESDSAALLLAGLALVGGLAALRRRRRDR